MAKLKFRKEDTVANLSQSQLELIASSDSSWLIYYIEENTIWDAHRIRLMLELGAIEAKRRLGKQIFRKEEGK